jgi:DNA repair protein RecO (recombination protein O)
MNRVDGESCFVLHLRPYRDTSALVNLFSPQYGRFTCVAKGLRGSSRSRQPWRAALQVFNAVSVNWQGRGELKSMLDVQHQRSYHLKERALFCGFYINELLERLLHQHDPQVEIFALYAQCLSELETAQDLQPSLRRFEFALLDALGYGLNFNQCNHTARPIEAGFFYQFKADQGLVFSDDGQGFAGEWLLQIANDDFSGAALPIAKQLARQALGALLGSKPLLSRDLFIGSHKPS